GTFRALQETAWRDTPAWLAQLRAAGLARLEVASFPTTDEEDWKYTNVAPIVRGEFSLLDSTATEWADAGVVASFIYEETRQSHLAFVNGIYRPELSALGALPAGVVVMNLADAIGTEHEEKVRAYLAQSADIDEHADGFMALNTAFFNHGAFIYLPKGAQLSAPLQLLFVADGATGRPAIFPAVLLVAERESAATIIESYEAAAAAPSFT